ncbi:hypothetical protein BZA77DRAFT_343357 [Pyronema omphalodes]|nr:hypothetical protein BZA77DRAFT_343357 [Pyronema omphalodes]
MSFDNSCAQSVCTSTPASCTPGSDTPSTSEIMSTAPTLIVDLQIPSPAYDNMRRSFQDNFTSNGLELARLEIENMRLMEHNTAIEKEFETVKEHNTAAEKKLETLKEEIIKLYGANSDAMKKLAEVQEEKADLQKELVGLRELEEVRRWKKCEELETRVTEKQERTEKLIKDYQREMDKRATGNQASIENLVNENQKIMKKLIEEYQQKMEERMVDAQYQSQLNLGILKYEINRIKVDHTREMQTLTSAMGFKGLEAMKDGYIVKDERFESIPCGMIQVSRAKARARNNDVSVGRLCEDKNTRFLYVVRDQYRDFMKSPPADRWNRNSPTSL